MNTKHMTEFTTFGALGHTPFFQMTPGGVIWEKLENGEDTFRHDTGEVLENLCEDRLVIPVEDVEDPPLWRFFGDLKAGTYFCQSPGGPVWKKQELAQGDDAARRVEDGKVNYNPNPHRRVIPVSITLMVEHSDT